MCQLLSPEEKGTQGPEGCSDLSVAPEKEHRYHWIQCQWAVELDRWVLLFQRVEGVANRPLKMLGLSCISFGRDWRGVGQTFRGLWKDDVCCVRYSRALLLAYFEEVSCTKPVRNRNRHTCDADSGN